MHRWGKSLSKGYNLWKVREAGEGNSKKSLGNIQPPERAGRGKYTQCAWRKLNTSLSRSKNGSRYTHKHANCTGT